MSSYDGTVSLAIGGDHVELGLTWRNMVALRDVWGAESYVERYADALNQRNWDDIAYLIEIAGGPDKDTLLDAPFSERPSANDAIAALEKLWLVFWFGPNGPPDAEETGANPLTAQLTSWMKRFSPRFAPASVGPKSTG